MVHQQQLNARPQARSLHQKLIAWLKQLYLVQDIVPHLDRKADKAKVA
jgi:hypothetical protein